VPKTSTGFRAKEGPCRERKRETGGKIPSRLLVIISSGLGEESGFAPPPAKVFGLGNGWGRLVALV
jgi:hypothetical protein